MMEATLLRYQFATITAAIQALPSQISGNAAPQYRPATPPVGALSIGTPSVLFRGATMIDMCAAAGGGLVNLAEIEAAAHHVSPGADYTQWRDGWLFPISSAIAIAPQLEPQLRRIFDDVNRRTADPQRVAAWQDGDYFGAADQQLTNAIAASRRKTAPGDAIAHARILQLALDNGWDGRTAAHLAAANSNTQTATTVVLQSVVTPGVPAKVTLFFSPVAFAAADLHPVQWLVPGLLIRGEITVLTSLGGGAKTAAAIHLAVALASGRGHVGPFSVNSSSNGLRVAIISAEEDANRIGLLVSAACSVMQMNPTARKSVAQNLLMHDARGSGWESRCRACGKTYRQRTWIVAYRR